MFSKFIFSWSRDDHAVKAGRSQEPRDVRPIGVVPIQTPRGRENLSEKHAWFGDGTSRNPPAALSVQTWHSSGAWGVIYLDGGGFWCDRSHGARHTIVATLTAECCSPR